MMGYRQGDHWDFVILPISKEGRGLHGCIVGPYTYGPDHQLTCVSYLEVGKKHQEIDATQIPECLSQAS